jgi:hypothetical protein
MLQQTIDQRLKQQYAIAFNTIHSHYQHYWWQQAAYDKDP